MRLKIEYIPPDVMEEVVIRCHSRTENVEAIERAVKNLVSSQGEFAASLGDVEYFIPENDILFFETLDGKIGVHTTKNMYYTGYKLFELENIMPKSFVRVSKCCILNSSKVSSLAHNLTGASRVTFYDSDKAVYVSRNYYKILKEKIYEMRLHNKRGGM
jgi:DNA-binding LytR/AlgR family response regulator